MSVDRMSCLELLHRVCEQRGLALLLVASHTDRGFAVSSKTTLVFLDVVELAPGAGSRKQRLRGGDLAIRADLSLLDGDLEAAAELLVGLLTRTRRQAA